MSVEGQHAAGMDRRMVMLMLYGLAFWALYIAYAVHMDIVGYDFGAYYRAGSNPPAIVYAPASPFPYPPTTLVWLRPLSIFAEPFGYALWIALSVGALAWTSARLAGRRVALMVVASPALATTIAVGQMGALIGAAILLAVSLKGWRQGLLLGLAATVKPQILLAAPLLLLARRDWAALFGAAIGVGLSVVAELLVIGPGAWLQWVRGLIAFPKVVARLGAYAGSVSPAGVASQLHWPTLPFLLLGCLLALTLIWKRARLASPIELAALIIIASALMSPYLLVYDIAAMMPFVAQRLLERDARTGFAALVGFLNPFAGVGPICLALSLVRPDVAAPERLEPTPRYS